jgi:hypothetical protein
MRKTKASEELPLVWEEKLFAPLRVLGFKEYSLKHSVQNMNKDVRSKRMPPEYKNRPLHQGAQRKFFWKGKSKSGRKNRVITVLTSVTVAGKKKIKYQGWVRMSGASLPTDLVSFPVNDTPSFFSVMVGYAKAFKDVSEYWPIDALDGSELSLVHLYEEHIFHMMKFVSRCTYPARNQNPLSVLLTEITLPSDSKRFLKAKFLPSYRKQLKEKESGNAGGEPRRLQRSRKRKEAFRT